MIAIERLKWLSGKSGSESKNFERALPLLQAVAAKNPADDQIHYLLAQTWRGLGKPEVAAKKMQLHQQNLRRLAEPGQDQLEVSPHGR